MGAALRPHCLVKVVRHSEPVKSQSGVAEIYIKEPGSSRHDPWKSVGEQRKKDKEDKERRTDELPEWWVPEAWVIRPVCSSSELLNFVTRPSLSATVLPLTKAGEPDPERHNNDYWINANQVYCDYRGKGRGTPEDLLSSLDYNGKLSYQTRLPLRPTGEHLGSRLKVLYNASGSRLRAARVSVEVIAEERLYHCTTDTEEEAAYLTAVLNAQALQRAFAGARKSDRDFHLRIWEAVPIVQYDPTDDGHRGLVSLCEKAEKFAEDTSSFLSETTGQITASKRIRERLDKEGISDKIDSIVRRLLPHHTTW